MPVFVAAVCLFGLLVAIEQTRREKERLAKMTPEEREEYRRKQQEQQSLINNDYYYNNYDYYAVPDTPIPGVDMSPITSSQECETENCSCYSDEAYVCYPDNQCYSDEAYVCYSDNQCYSDETYVCYSDNQCYSDEVYICYSDNQW